MPAAKTVTPIVMKIAFWDMDFNLSIKIENCFFITVNKLLLKVCENTSLFFIVVYLIKQYVQAGKEYSSSEEGRKKKKAAIGLYITTAEDDQNRQLSYPRTCN